MLLQVTLYRRMQPDLPERSWAGPCGMSVVERLLVSNHGKDGASFYVSTLLPHEIGMPGRAALPLAGFAACWSGRHVSG